MEFKNLKGIEMTILSIILRKRRSMTSKQITKELKKIGINVSRPTVAKYLKDLKKKGYIKETEED